jgi:hypothetical protein
MFFESADPELTAVVPSQDDVTPIIATAIRDGADRLPGVIREAFHLLTDDAVQLKAKRYKFPELPSRDSFDRQDATFAFLLDSTPYAGILSVGLA